MPSETQRYGFAKERRAAERLVELGYRIVATNWRGGGSEIDLIAYDGEVLCIVEVRARGRSDFGLPMETVDETKQKKLVRAAMAYLMKFSPRRVPMVRFDVVSIVDGDPPDVAVVTNAFEAPG